MILDQWSVVSTVGSRVLFGLFFYSRVYSDHIGGLSFEDLMGVQQNTMKREGNRVIMIRHTKKTSLYIFFYQVSLSKLFDLC